MEDLVHVLTDNAGTPIEVGARVLVVYAEGDADQGTVAELGTTSVAVRFDDFRLVGCPPEDVIVMTLADGTDVPDSWS